jgi:hypothetical protein
MVKRTRDGDKLRRSFTIKCKDSPWKNSQNYDWGEIQHPDTGSLVYRGYFKDNLMHGTGVTFDFEYGFPDYEGEFFMGKKHGRGKVLTPSGLVVYEGSWKDGEIYGRGVWRGDQEFTYCGDMQNSMPHGKGIRLGSAGKVYDGSFSEGQYHGEGRIYSDNQVVYDGQFEKGLRSGHGKEFVTHKGKSICVYEGEFLGGKNQGNGTQYSITEKILYTGEFADGKRCGHGNLFNKDGRKIFVGEFQDGHNIGTGHGYLYSQANGSLLYEGEIKTLDHKTRKLLRGITVIMGGHVSKNVMNGGSPRRVQPTGPVGQEIALAEIRKYKKHGHGREFNSDEAVIYEGQFQDDYRHGTGCQYDAETKLKLYDGNFQHGIRSGQGQELNCHGDIIYEGMWYKGCKVLESNMQQLDQPQLHGKIFFGTGFC